MCDVNFDVSYFLDSSVIHALGIHFFIYTAGWTKAWQEMVYKAL